jgi:hypothetical protein
VFQEGTSRPFNHYRLLHVFCLHAIRSHFEYMYTDIWDLLSFRRTELHSLLRSSNSSINIRILHEQRSNNGSGIWFDYRCATQPELFQGSANSTHRENSIRFVLKLVSTMFRAVLNYILFTFFCDSRHPYYRRLYRMPLYRPSLPMIQEVEEEEDSIGPRKQKS